MNKTIIDLPTTTTVGVNDLFYVGNYPTGALSNVSFSVLRNLFNVEQQGVSTFSGTGSLFVFSVTFPQPFDHIPVVIATAASDNALFYSDATTGDTKPQIWRVQNATTTGFHIVFTSTLSAPISGTNNLSFNWIAK